MKLLIKEQQESHENGKICYIRKETFENKYFKNCKKALQNFLVKLEIIAIIQENIEKLYIAYVI